MFEYEKQQILGYINYLLPITCISFKILFFFLKNQRIGVSEEKPYLLKYHQANDAPLTRSKDTLPKAIDHSTKWGKGV